MALKAHPDLNLDTSIITKNIVPISKKVSRLMNMPTQRNKAIVGANAFAHSSGIHQDGFLKNRENYEIINPEDVGLKASSIDLTARSGRAALKHRLKLLGFSFSKVELETIYIKFIEMADEKKLLHDEDLYELMKKYN
jgi:2-isopropylmalate synthase